eukprot:10140388-Lingulodinium_polyedra.AAC.1
MVRPGRGRGGGKSRQGGVGRLILDGAWRGGCPGRRRRGWCDWAKLTNKNKAGGGPDVVARGQRNLGGATEAGVTTDIAK